jgi:hypothetical protein
VKMGERAALFSTDVDRADRSARIAPRLIERLQALRERLLTRSRLLRVGWLGGKDREPAP